MIQFIDLRLQYHRIWDELERAVLRSLRSEEYILGQRANRLGKSFSQFVGKPRHFAVRRIPRIVAALKGWLA